jgi:HlyD family secretion protein
MKQLKGILKWVLILAALGAVAYIATLVWPKKTTTTTTAQATSYTQDYTVAKGNITASISPIGQVYAPHQTSLYFDANNIPLVAVQVKAGQQVQAGAVLAKIDASVLQGALDKAEAAMLSAGDALDTAQSPYTEIAKRQADAAVAQAKSNLEAARKKLADLQNPDLTTAEKNVQTAQQNVPAVRDKLAALKADPAPQTQLDTLQWKANEAEAYHGQQLSHASTANPSEQQLDYEVVTRNLMLDAQEAVQRAKIQIQLDRLKAEHDVVAADVALSNAKQALADLRAGPDATALAQAQNAVSQGEYSVAKAQDNLATLLAGPDPEAVRLAQARYDAAKATYDQAKAALDGSTMVAPFAGTVVTVNAAVGDLVSPNLVIVTLADLTELRVLANIDETQISDVEVGQQVQVTLDALPGKRLQGQVLEVPIEGTLSNNVVTYAVDISLKNGGDAALKPGMTANLQVVTGSKQGVLLLPTLGITQNAEGTFAIVRESGGITSTVPIQIGLRSGSYAEIVRGLNEGDTVVVTYQAQQQQRQQQGQQGQQQQQPPQAPSGNPSGNAGGNGQRSGQ